MSIYGGVQKCHKQIMDLADLSIESSSPHPHKAIDFQAMRDTISGNTCISICVKKNI